MAGDSQRRPAALERARALLATAPAQVASDCAIAMLGTVTLLLVLANHIWEAVIPGAIALGLQALDERVADETVLSRPYVVFRRALFGVLLLALVTGLWLHAATREWSVAIHAVLATLLLAVLIIAHTPWAHWLNRLGRDEEPEPQRDSELEP